MTFRPAHTCLFLAAMAQSTAAQEFSFRQSCTLTLDACDMIRDGGEACPTGKELAVDFWAEGENFYIRVARAAETGFGKGTADLFELGQGYFDEKLRVYYLRSEAKVDGVFWISIPDRTSGAQLYWAGQEDYFSGSCIPLD